MQLTLLESDRSFFHSAEWVVVSVVAHFGVLGMLLSATADGTRLPVTERDDTGRRGGGGRARRGVSVTDRERRAPSVSR